MKKLLYILAAVVLATAAASCGKYDDSELRGKISDLEDRVEQLEWQMTVANSNIDGLKNIVASLEGKISIISVTETSDGYEIKFSNNTTVTIRDGKSPVIGVKKDSDGIWYWTLDGEWLKDGSGNKLAVTGNDGAPGAPGADAVAPQLKIEGNYWYISTDGGATWTQAGWATGNDGKDGDSMFQWVNWDESFWYFALANGDIIKIGRGAAGALAINAVPDCSDGSVNARKDVFTIHFAILPDDAAEGLAALSADIFRLGVVYTTHTKASAGDEILLPIIAKEAVDGKLLLTVDGSELDDGFTAGVLGASAKLDVVWGDNVMTSGYFPLRFKKNYVGVDTASDLQAALDEAEDGSEIRVAAGVRIPGPVYIVKNIKLSGGWTDNFTRQDLSNRSIIDGCNVNACVASGIGPGGARYPLDNAVLSGFDIRNGVISGIVLHGKLTVEYCWVHHCFSSGKGGGISCTEMPGDELLLANSILEYNKADAHGGALSIAGNDTRMTVVNCLFRGNASIAQYGYTGAIHGQAGVQAFLCNNTIVENVNWRDGSSATSTPWSAVMFRNGGTHAVLVNNIIAGNYYFLPGVASNYDDPYRYEMPIDSKYIMEMQVQHVDLNIMAGDDPDCICRSNILGGSDSDNFIGRAGYGLAQAEAQAACMFVHNSKYGTLFVDAAAGDYRPAGPALYSGESSELVNSLLGAYDTDLEGKPRFTGSRISAGCFEP